MNTLPAILAKEQRNGSKRNNAPEADMGSLGMFVGTPRMVLGNGIFIAVPGNAPLDDGCDAGAAATVTSRLLLRGRPDPRLQQGAVKQATCRRIAQELL
jgi:hypothetical protein